MQPEEISGGRLVGGVVENLFAIEFYDHAFLHHAHFEASPLVGLAGPFELLAPDEAAGGKGIVRRSDVELVAILRHAGGLDLRVQKDSAVRSFRGFEL